MAWDRNDLMDWAVNWVTQVDGDVCNGHIWIMRL
jgi:hypothetical protein